MWMISAALGFIGAAALWFRSGWQMAASLFLGAAVAIVNLRWMEFSVRRMFDAQLGERRGSKRLVWKALLRYAFLGAVAYVIFKGYFVSVRAFLVGLFVPIAALMIEAAYEMIVALRS